MFFQTNLKRNKFSAATNEQKWLLSVLSGQSKVHNYHPMAIVAPASAMRADSDPIDHPKKNEKVLEKGVFKSCSLKKWSSIGFSAGFSIHQSKWKTNDPLSNANLESILPTCMKGLMQSTSQPKKTRPGQVMIGLFFFAFGIASIMLAAMSPIFCCSLHYSACWSPLPPFPLTFRRTTKPQITSNNQIGRRVRQHSADQNHVLGTHPEFFALACADLMQNSQFMACENQYWST